MTDKLAKQVALPRKAIYKNGKLQPPKAKRYGKSAKKVAR